MYNKSSSGSSNEREHLETEHSERNAHTKNYFVQQRFMSGVCDCGCVCVCEWTAVINAHQHTMANAYGAFDLNWAPMSCWYYTPPSSDASLSLSCHVRVCCGQMRANDFSRFSFAVFFFVTCAPGSWSDAQQEVEGGRTEKKEAAKYTRNERDGHKKFMTLLRKWDDVLLSAEMD